MRMMSFLSLLFFVQICFAHPGVTDKKGCHINSDTGRKHCHKVIEKEKLREAHTQQIIEKKQGAHLHQIKKKKEKKTKSQTVKNIFKELDALPLFSENPQLQAFVRQEFLFKS